MIPGFRATPEPTGTPSEPSGSPPLAQPGSGRSPDPLGGDSSPTHVQHFPFRHRCGFSRSPVLPVLPPRLSPLPGVAPPPQPLIGAASRGLPGPRLLLADTAACQRIRPRLLYSPAKNPPESRGLTRSSAHSWVLADGCPLAGAGERRGCDLGQEKLGFLTATWDVGPSLP